MRVPEAAELLDVWEGGLAQSLPRRALALLAVASPDLSEDELLVLPIGRRDARLLQLRRWLFGPEVRVVAQCPECGETLESTFRVDAVILADVSVGDEVQAIDLDGYRVTFRLPASADLLAISKASRGPALRNRLLTRCVIDIRQADGADVIADALPEPVAAAIAARMAAADPQADVEIELTCPACAHRWQALFDIASFLWAEIHAWARRTLRDVHTLARAYGWREADVLALSPTRRQIYLELARQ